MNFDAVERQEHFGMWLVIFILLVLWFLFAYMAWFAWRKMQENLNTYAQKLDKAEWDIHYCWTQVADEDNYIAQQAARIDGLHNQFMMLDGRLTEASNEASMSHDFMVGLHYSVVELGGFLRFPFGVEPSDLKPGKSQLGSFQCDGSRAIPQPGETTCVCGRWRNNRCADEWKPKYRRDRRE